IIDKYKPQQKYHSDWDSRIIIGLLVMIFIVGFLASGINYITIGLAITWLMKREKAEQAINWVLGSKRGAEARDYFKDKRWCIIMTATVITFALILALYVWHGPRTLL
ncbi:MAG: mechanosensitive ion channel family protein, partial [Prevotellaceae bacterium]|nr:mechanosensitive ion channel family protein [Prevotellaceae bacterium]